MNILQRKKRKEDGIEQNKEGQACPSEHFSLKEKGREEVGERKEKQFGEGC